MTKGELIEALKGFRDDAPLWIYDDEHQSYAPLEWFVKGYFRNFRWQRRTSNMTTMPVELTAIVLTLGWTGSMENLQEVQ